MNILEALKKLRDDIKIWATNNFIALNSKIKNIQDNESDKFEISDLDGNIIFRVDATGVETTQIKASEISVNSTSLNQAMQEVKDHIDNTDQHVTAIDKDRWDSKSDFSGKYVDLEEAPDILDDESDTLSVQDLEGNIVAKIDAEGIHSINFHIKDEITNVDVNIADKITTWDAKPTNDDVDSKINTAINELPQWAKEATKPEYNKNEIGLDQVDNTADIDKPISNETQAALDTLKATLNEKIESESEDFTIADADGNAIFKVDASGLSTTDILANKAIINGVNIEDKLSSHIGNQENPHAVSKEQVGLGNADNTSDIDKPVSAATQKALDDLKEEVGNKLESDADSLKIADDNGNVIFQVAADGVNTTNINTSRIVAQSAEVNGLDIEEELNKKALNSALEEHVKNIDNPHAVNKSQVGLGNVDNTSDMNKPVSTAQQAAINAAKSELSESITSDSDDFAVIDPDGNIIFKISEDGVHTSEVVAKAININSAVIDEISAISDAEIDTIFDEFTASLNN